MAGLLGEPAFPPQLGGAVALAGNGGDGGTSTGPSPKWALWHASRRSAENVVRTLWIVIAGGANEPRGACHGAQIPAPHTCIRLDRDAVPTMKQSFASTARLRGSGPILTSGSKTMFRLGSPPPRIVVGHSPGSPPVWPKLKIYLRVDRSGYVTARNTTPAGTSPVVTMRQSAISNFLANATISFVLRPPEGPSVRALNQSTSALSF